MFTSTKQWMQALTDLAVPSSAAFNERAEYYPIAL